MGRTKRQKFRQGAKPVIGGLLVLVSACARLGYDLLPAAEDEASATCSVGQAGSTVQCRDAGGVAGDGGGFATAGAASGGTDAAVPGCVGDRCDAGQLTEQCDGDCPAAQCGDGIVDTAGGEECEPALLFSCQSDCTIGYLASLQHRYRFDGSGVTLTDSIGSAHGGLQGGVTLAGTGELNLSGTIPEQYGDLPNGIVSSLTDATFEAWFTWNGTDDWQRIFDFGNNNAGEGAQGDGLTYLFLTPQGLGPVRASFSVTGQTLETVVIGSAALPSGAEQHVVVVVDDTNDELLLYVNGQLDGSVAFLGSLSNISDENNWLGRSQWTADSEFEGSFSEFRIYSKALSVTEIETSYQSGADQLRCGDGRQNAGEQCDDGGETSECNANCTTSACGDGVVNRAAGEFCEPSLDAACLGDCSIASTLPLIAHRYGFDGTGGSLTDEVGGSNGTLSGGANLNGSGQVDLAGGTSEQFADLPNGIVSSLTDATFEAWFTWNGTEEWERIFDFGSSTSGEGNQGDGLTYFFLSPNAFGAMRATFTASGNAGETTVIGSGAAPAGVETHIAVVVDDTNDTLQLYVNGELDASVDFPDNLSGLDDVNNWLGRAQWTANPEFTGSISEFRIYSVALSPGQVLRNYLIGGRDE